MLPMLHHPFNKSYIHFLSFIFHRCDKNNYCARWHQVIVSVVWNFQRTMKHWVDCDDFADFHKISIGYFNNISSLIINLWITNRTCVYRYLWRELNSYFLSFFNLNNRRSVGTGCTSGGTWNFFFVSFHVVSECECPRVFEENNQMECS